MARKKAAQKDVKTEDVSAVKDEVLLDNIKAIPEEKTATPIDDIEVEVPGPAPVEEKKEEPVPEPIPAVVPAPVEVPRAIVVDRSTENVSAVAKKTCVKFIVGWRHLVEGQRITAPRSVIELMRQSGLVE